MATASRTVTMRWLRFFGSRPDGWWRDRGRAMAALVKRLEQRAAAEGADVTVVFERPLSPPIESSVINVANAPKAAANSADDEIVRLVRADSDPAQIRVATSDRMLPSASRQPVPAPMTPGISQPAVALITRILVAIVSATNGLEPADPNGSRWQCHAAERASGTRRTRRPV
jgi:hypothetical protein